MRRIAGMQIHEPNRLTITWRDGGVDTIDLAGVIAGFEPFAPLHDFALFRTATLVGHGSGIEWANGLSYSTDSLECLAEEQRVQTGEDFKKWQKSFDLSLQETADLFGVALTTVKAYRKLDVLPVAVQIACSAMKRERDVFLAHYRPRINGRPKKKRDLAAAE